MSFEKSSRNIPLNAGNVTILRAECQQRNGKWRWSSIILDAFVGSVDGDFRVGGWNFTTNATNVRLCGGTLLVALLRIDGSKYVPAASDLSLYIENIDGHLTAVNIPPDTFVVSPSF
ncbi:hypothetical protein AN958_00587 [Leucoagaricus sp. SymC.cos]|nr:hypothetical protein AN958_00587 [Leucoagaricus sp. SymC.cos]